MENQVTYFTPPYDPFAPKMSFKEFKEIMSRNRNPEKVSTIVFDEFTELRGMETPRFTWSLNPAKDHWITEQLKDKDK